MKIKPLGKLIIFLLVVCAAYSVYRVYDRMTGTAVTFTRIAGDQGVLGRPLIVALNEWPGFVGGLFANDGLKPNHDCIFYKKGKLLVEFKIMDDPDAMSKAYAHGDVDVIWSTIDTTVVQLGGFAKGGKPTKVFMQCDWSRGGDAILGIGGIHKIEDLAGKKVALITETPSEYLLQYGLRNSSLPDSEQKRVLQKMVGMDDPDKLQKALASGSVPAIVTWEPTISSTLAALKDKGVHVVLSTETVANSIADVFMASDDFIKKNPEAIKAFIDGWFEGALEANRDNNKAVKVVMANMPMFKDLGADKTSDTFTKVKLADMGDNAKTFGLAGGKPLFDDIYNDATSMYEGRGVLQSKVSTSEAKDDSLLKQLYEEIKPEERPLTPKEEFHVSPAQRAKAESSTAVMTKPVNIYFATGSASLDENAKSVLASVQTMLEQSSNAVIGVEGNTDSVGSVQGNVVLSRRRAQAVVDYLVAQGFDRARFIAKGNGPNNPVASNATAAGRQKNRRTDIRVKAK